MKTCKKCKETFSEEQFHKDSSHKDGLRSVCRYCEAVRRQQDRVVNRGRYLEKDHKYNDAHKGLRAETKRAWNLNNHAKISAHNKVRYALQTGSLAKGLCEDCSSPLVEAHHRDYKKPLDVQWLCRKHHMLLEHGLVSV